MSFLLSENYMCFKIVGFLCYYRDFDEGLSQTMAIILYEIDVAYLPSTCDISNYLVREVRTLDSLCHYVSHIILFDYILVCTMTSSTSSYPKTCFCSFAICGGVAYMMNQL